MADIVNLNRFRKNRQRLNKEKQAEENRVRFGRTKSEKMASKTDFEKTERLLDGKKREDSEPES